MDTKLLTFLARGAASISELAHAGSILLERDDAKRLQARRETLDRLLDGGLVAQRQGRVEISGVGLTWLARCGQHADATTDRHRQIEAVSMVEDGEQLIVAVNINESPLANLARRRDKSGRAFLSTTEFEAGERLRSDFTRGQMMPRLGANWEASVASGRRDGSNGAADLSDSALAARQRVDAALQAVGPELSGVLLDVCCFLKGLETVEGERGWPVRSAKIILKAALSALARHYNPAPARSSRMQHWGAPGYRPATAL